jgi:hypothetical protein
MRITLVLLDFSVNPSFLEGYPVYFYGEAGFAVHFTEVGNISIDAFYNIFYYHLFLSFRKPNQEYWEHREVLTGEVSIL